MRNDCYKKGIVLSIIVLFLGVGFQPALANEVSITKISDVDGDCNCKPINEIHLVRIERLLNRLESRINFILLKYGHVPEVAEKCDEVLELINSDDLSPFCGVIGVLGLFFLGFGEILPFLLVIAFIFFVIFMTFCE